MVVPVAEIFHVQRRERFLRPLFGGGAADVTWGRYFLGNMLPVTLGNIAGGLLVGWLAWYCFLRKKG